MSSIKGLNLDDLVGQDVGTSTLIREIARGGMAVVFAAYQKSLKRRIAVKILPKTLLTPMTGQIFQQEAEAAAILSHPNIIPIYEVGETCDFLFFTMQLVNGRSLSDHIRRARRNPVPSKRIPPLKTSLQIIIQVLDALDYAHQHDVIHRDIKPGNILIENHTKRPILLDFGIARIARGPDLTSSMLLGTPTYMAPEQILKADVDGRADIYATGIMLLEMLIPIPLFQELDSVQDLLKMKLKRKDRLFDKRPSEMNPMVGKEMDAILSKALRYDPKRRYPTCGEFRARLQAYMEQHSKGED